MGSMDAIVPGSDRGKVQASDGDDHGGATASLHRDASGSDADAYQTHAEGGHGDRRHRAGNTRVSMERRGIDSQQTAPQL
jgi:hypothetical protein